MQYYKSTMHVYMSDIMWVILRDSIQRYFRTLLKGMFK